MASLRVSADDLILATSLNYWRYAVLGPPGSPIRPLSALWTSQRVMAGDEFVVAGLWGRLGKHRAAVFVRDGQPRVAFDRNEWPLDDGLDCQLAELGETTSLRLQRHGNVVASCEYRTPKKPRQHWLEWPLDREDWDFGHFIARMIDRRLEEPLLETVWPFPRRLRGPDPTAA